MNLRNEEMNKVGISSFAYSFAIGSRPYDKPERLMTPFDLMDKATSLGAEVVQFGDNLPLEHYDDSVLNEIRSYAEERGLELELGMRKATPDRIAEHVRITEKIGGRFLRVITDGADYKPTYDECLKVFAETATLLEEAGVTIGIENHDRFKTREYAKMVKSLNHPLIGMTVDTLNSMSIEESIDEVLDNAAPFCACLHIKDYEIKRYNGGGGLKISGTCLGTGRLDLQKCIERCREESRYSFNIILESWMEPCETLAETLRKEDEWARAGIDQLKKRHIK